MRSRVKGQRLYIGGDKFLAEFFLCLVGPHFKLNSPSLQIISGTRKCMETLRCVSLCRLHIESSVCGRHVGLTELKGREGGRRKRKDYMMLFSIV